MATPSLRQLRAYRAVLSLGSVAKAAETLNLSQPALSKQIAALEHTLSLKLFERRRGGPMTPTGAGMEFYKSIESTLFGLDSIADIAKGIAETGSRRLTVVGTPPVLNSKPFAEALAATSNSFPHLRCTLELRTRIEVESMVVNRHADVGFGLATTPYPDLKDIVIAESCVMAVVAASHALAKKKTIQWTDLEGHHLILPNRQPLRDRINNALPEISGAYEVSSSVTGCNLAVAGVGIALSDPFSPTTFERSVLRAIPMQPEIELVYAAMLPTTAQRNEPLDALLENFKAFSHAV